MNRLIKGLGIVLLLAGIGVASAFAVIVLLLNQEEVRVPDLAGKDIVTAVELLAQQGLQLKVERREPSAAAPKDTVISQSPSAGTGIKKGRQVRLVVSLGPSDLRTPKVTGVHFRKAEVLVRQAGLLTGNVGRTTSDTVERDVVIAQSPEPETPLEKGGAVSLLVSTGREVQLFAMPKLTGKSAESAVRAVEAMGLQHRVTYRQATGRTLPGERLVLSQRPAAGVAVGPDGIVELVVSR